MGGSGKKDKIGLALKLFHNLSQSPFLRYRLYNWLLNKEGYIGCCYDLWYSLFYGLLYCLSLLSFFVLSFFVFDFVVDCIDSRLFRFCYCCFVVMFLG